MAEAELTTTVPAAVAHGVLDLARFKRDERRGWIAPDGRRTWVADEALGWALTYLAKDSEAVLLIYLVVWRRKASRSEAQRAAEATRHELGAGLIADFVAILKEVFDSGLPTAAEGWDFDACTILDRLLPLLGGHEPRRRDDPGLQAAGSSPGIGSRAAQERVDGHDDACGCARGGCRRSSPAGKRSLRDGLSDPPVAEDGG